jgi:Family of unknown function (DUF5989)
VGMARLRDAARIVRDSFRFAQENKRWWLLPLLAVAGLLVALVVATATPVAPFIYTLF